MNTGANGVSCGGPCGAQELLEMGKWDFVKPSLTNDAPSELDERTMQWSTMVPKLILSIDRVVDRVAAN